jgi:signal transduction histidine kinase
MEIVFDYRREVESSREQREQERVEQLAACYQAYLGHELPNQLVPIQAFARMLLEHHAAALDEEGRLLLDRLAALTQRTDILARRVAEIGRLLRDSPWGLPLSLDELVREAIAEVNVLGVPAGITYDIQQPLPAVHASRRLLHQVLVQLLRNAGQALASGGSRSAKDSPGVIGVSGWREANGTFFQVRDTGRGMTEAQVALFEPFAAGRFPGAGPGLGLFLVCQATARWGGLLRVRSEPGQGSVFSLFLPDPGTARQATSS